MLPAILIVAMAACRQVVPRHFARQLFAADNIQAFFSNFDRQLSGFNIYNCDDMHQPL
jgi:hypothetical protein